jgi:hypothetical protein
MSAAVIAFPLGFGRLESAPSTIPPCVAGGIDTEGC